MTTSKQIKKEKYSTINGFLADEYVLLHINPKHKGLSIPAYLQTSNSVTLKISRFFRGTLEVTQSKITAELLFSGTYHTCIIPLDAIWSVTAEKGENVIWPDSAPKEIISDVFKHLASKEQSTAPLQEQQQTPEPLPSKGHLRRVK
ncbi:MAG: hypothetical protein ACOX2O_03825 [Bdellovibrionota bacterium]|jgi:stringent starvation protein B